MKEKLAELIGIILGDGSIGIYNNIPRLKITLNSEKDLEYAYYVIRLLDEIFEAKSYLYKRKNEKTLDIIVKDKIVVEYLLKIGMKLAPKWGRARVPHDYLKGGLGLKVIRGYMDTDGCITVFDNNGTLYPRIEMKISQSPMQNQLIDILKKHNFKPRVNNIGRGKKRIMLAGKQKLLRWYCKIGFSNKRNIVIAERFIKKIAGSGIPTHFQMVENKI